MTDTCLCGAEPGYPHDPSCPYPLYRGSAAQEQDWRKARADKRARNRAERAKVPDDREFAKAAEFRRVWETLQDFSACGAWGSAECGRVWAEYLAAGMPDDVADHIRRRANRTANGTEPGMV